MVTTATRYHDISTGHRVVGHESKCRHMHGHNYRIHFTCSAPDLDTVGRVIDFTVIKEKLCAWVEKHWDHKFLAWDQDPVMSHSVEHMRHVPMYTDSVVFVPFNPTAENMAEYLVSVVGPAELQGTNVVLTSVVIEETAKCRVEHTI